MNQNPASSPTRAPARSALVPALSGAPARAAREVAGQVAERLAVPPDRSRFGYGPRSRRWDAQSLAHGAAGVAILHAERARDGSGDPDRVHPWLAAAVAEDLSAASGSGPWFGAPAVANAFRHASPPGTYPRARARLDAALIEITRRRLDAARERITARRRPHLAEFDLVNGLTGLGAALLQDSAPDPQGVAVAREVLTYLVALTEPVDADDTAGLSVPGWWTADAPSGRPGVEGGHADLGMAHGIAGPLALLALTARDGLTVPGQHQAIDRICRWYDHHARPDARTDSRADGQAGGRVDGAVWWPPRLTWHDLQAPSTSTENVEAAGRPSWCYGTPGIARAHQLAGLALDDPDRQTRAQTALLNAVTDPAQLDQLGDVSLCHGWAGATLTLWCAARDSTDTRVRAALPVLAERLTAATRPHPPDAPIGLIHGHAGAALALHTLASGRLGGWARCLVLT